jgi:hypothetical protein
VQPFDGASGAEDAVVVKPRIARVLKGDDYLGLKTVELAHEAGLELDEWQSFCVVESMRTRPDGMWAATEVGVDVARQNGKGGVIEARLLGALAVVESSLSIYSAHLFDTSLEHFRRLEFLIQETPKLSKQLAGGSRGFKHSHGEEGIEFLGNRRVRFKTRTKGGGRGFACDGVLIFDEAMVISEAMHGAVLPTMSAKTTEVPGPQLYYFGTAVDQLIHEHGVVFARVRERGHGLKGEAARLVWLEWSVEGDDPSAVPVDVLSDRAAWAQANPALGIRIAPEYVAETEFESMDARTFAVERLGIGDWPRTDHVSTVIDLDKWNLLEDDDSVLLDPVCFAFDVSPDRTTSISAAGRNQRGEWHVEVVEARKGTGWVPQRLAELKAKHNPLEIVCDAYGPAGSLMPALEALDLEVRSLTATEHAQACGQFVDLVDEAGLRHLGGELTNAIRAAKTRPLGDAWAWSRRNSTSNISPLVSATLALSSVIYAAPEAQEALTAWA